MSDVKTRAPAGAPDPGHDPGRDSVPRAEFDALARQVAGLIEHVEDLEDQIGALRYQADPPRREDMLPLELSRRITAGEHPARIWREHRGMKGNQLAAAAGITPGYLSEIEAGKKPGSARALAGIARALGVTVEDLLPAAD